MNSNQKEVLKKILYAVETGGQVYGKQNYGAFIGKGHNTPNEAAITIGAGQWYGTEAKRLLQEIQKADEEMFNRMDNAGVSADLAASVWSRYAISPDSAKAKCIISIITTEMGIKCQDALMLKQIEEHEKTITSKYGNMNAGAMMECINIIHQGGASALKRILAKTKKPYTAKSIYDALCTDPADKSNNNQVGDYVSRQKKVYEMIEKYCVEEKGENKMNEKQLRQKPVDYLNQFIGIREGSAEHKKILAVFNDSGLCKRYKMTIHDAWCATGSSASMIATGLAKIFPCVECSCGFMIDLAKKAGIWVENDAYVPKVGDQVLYDWDDTGAGDNTGWPDHVGVVASVSGNVITVIECNISNTVGHRQIAVNGRFIRGYVTPGFASMAGIGGTSTPSAPSESKSIAEVAKEVVAGQWGNGDFRKANLEAAGYDYEEVQAEVNKIMKGQSSGKKSVDVVAKEVLVGKWGNGDDRKVRLEAAGYDYETVQKRVNQLAGGSVPAAPSQPKGPTYKVGQVYTLQVELKVRVAAGTNSAVKSHSQLTGDGRNHDKDRDGCLDAGTKVTCQAVRTVGNDIWIKAPSGWMAAYYQGDIFIK